MITWGSKTGCGQQREGSSNPLHSNPQSVLEQPRNSNSGAKQSAGMERSMLVFIKFSHDQEMRSRGGTGMLRHSLNSTKWHMKHFWAA